MKIRAITAGVPGIPKTEEIRTVGAQLARLSEHFQSLGYLVQSRRVSLAHWKEGIGGLSISAREDLLLSVEQACAEMEIDYCSAGIAQTPPQIEHLAEVIARTTRINGSAEVASIEGVIDTNVVDQAAAAVLFLAKNTRNGFGNFRFGAACCLGPGTPFFPGSFADGLAPSFSIGCENSGSLVQAFASARNWQAAERELTLRLQADFLRISDETNKIADSIGLSFRGLDTSIAPSLDPEQSITRAFEMLGAPFGALGTLAICNLITGVLKRIPVKQIGYCGLMLPVLEDVGLARAAQLGQFSIVNLLAYSSVCGVGVDMVPVPGDVDVHSVGALFRDTASLALRLRKPLSVRLLPVPGKKAGEPCGFVSPYVCDGMVMAML